MQTCFGLFGIADKKAGLAEMFCLSVARLSLLVVRSEDPWLSAQPFGWVGFLGYI
jgi:hypothetical protein